MTEDLSVEEANALTDKVSETHGRAVLRQADLFAAACEKFAFDGVPPAMVGEYVVRLTLAEPERMQKILDAVSAGRALTGHGASTGFAVTNADMTAASFGFMERMENGEDVPADEIRAALSGITKEEK